MTKTTKNYPNSVILLKNRLSDQKSTFRGQLPQTRIKTTKIQILHYYFRPRNVWYGISSVFYPLKCHKWPKMTKNTTIPQTIPQGHSKPGGATCCELGWAPRGNFRVKSCSKPPESQKVFIFKFSLKFHRVSSSCEVPDENQMVKEGSDRDAEPHFPPQIIFSDSNV